MVKEKFGRNCLQVSEKRRKEDQFGDWENALTG